MSDSNNDFVNVIASQIQQWLSEFRNDRVTLELLHEIFEKKQQHNQIFKTFSSLSQMLWENCSLVEFRAHP